MFFIFYNSLYLILSHSFIQLIILFHLYDSAYFIFIYFLQNQKQKFSDYLYVS